MSEPAAVDPASLLSIGTPWFSADAVEWLEHNLAGTDDVVEFGGGRSSVFFLARCRIVTTFETSPSWTAALLGYLIEHPALYRRWRLVHQPVDWSPNWGARESGYWGEHEGSLTFAAARTMERTYLEAASAAAGATVVVVDGGMRSHLLVWLAESGAYARSEIVVVDNTEQKFPGVYCGADRFPGFRRFDFVAGSFDGDVAPLTDGRQITSVFVREDRLARLVPVETELPTTWTAEGLEPHRAYEPGDQARADADRWAARIRRELVDYGLLPAASTDGSGAELASLAHPVAEVVLEA